MMAAKTGGPAPGAAHAGRPVLRRWRELRAPERAGPRPGAPGLSALSCERALLERFLKALAANREQDPKLHAIRRLLLEDGWLEPGCILFSQYYDSAYWLAEQLSATLPDEPVGIYAGAWRSGLMQGGAFQRLPRDTLKAQVRDGEIRPRRP